MEFSLDQIVVAVLFAAAIGAIIFLNISGRKNSKQS